MKRSQFGEDEYIQKILGEIGEGAKVVCDIGARLQFSNSAHLIEDHGWFGILVEAAQDAASELEHVLGERATILCLRVDMENVNEIVPKNTQVLSIDIDSDDWWIWANLQYRPPLVIVETNPSEGLYVSRYKANGKHGGYGMSEDAAKALGALKGYQYLGRTAVNAFFLRNDLKTSVTLPGGPHKGVEPNPQRNVFCA